MIISYKMVLKLEWHSTHGAALNIIYMLSMWKMLCVYSEDFAIEASNEHDSLIVKLRTYLFLSFWYQVLISLKGLF